MEKRGTLTLRYPVTFKRTDQGFNELLRWMLSAEDGSSSFILYSFSEGILTKIVSGTKAPLDEEERERLDEGLAPALRPDEDVSVPEGRYLLRDFPDLAEESALPSVLSSFMAEPGSENRVWIRLYRENTLELVMQAIRPLL